MKRFYRLLKKILKGEAVTQLHYPAAEWDRQYEKGKWDYLLTGAYNVSVIVGIVRDHVHEQGKLKLLDVGCGNGALAQALLGLPVAYTGTDISEVALAQAKEFQPSGVFKKISMNDDPELEEQYDIIVFSEALYYGNYLETLSCHRKYLSPHGVVIISMHDTWRTRYIWWKMTKFVNVSNSVFVKDTCKGVSWNIKVCKLI